MEFQWQYAKELFSKLQQPDYGTTESWSSWYEKAWGHLSRAGFAKVETPLDLTRIKLRIAATCWLSLDFVAGKQANESCNTFFWSDWISDLEIIQRGRWRRLTAAKLQNVTALRIQSELR